MFVFELFVNKRTESSFLVFTGIMSIYGVYSVLSSQNKVKSTYRNYFRTIFNLKEEINIKYNFNESFVIIKSEFMESKIDYTDIDKITISKSIILMFIPNGTILNFPTNKIKHQDQFIDFVENISTNFQIIVERLD